MRITRLPKIKGYRVFRDFTWPDVLHDFARFNVIYGWNGSGKTTLSSLFENLQDKRAVSNGDVVFALDDRRTVSGGSIAEESLPQVRVFNRDFVVRTIEAIGESNVAPIYYLGKESIDKQKQIESLRDELQKAVETSTRAESKKRKAEQALDGFCIEKAKLVKEALLGSPEHANYDKRRFRQAVAKIKGVSPRPQPLSDEEKAAFRKQKELKPKVTIPKILAPSMDIVDLKSRMSTLLGRSVVSQVITDLANDPAVGAWVQRGLSLHRGERETDTCRFCGNEFSTHRRVELEAHFNNAFASFQDEVEQEIKEINRLRESLEAVAFPDTSRFYENLAEEAEKAIFTAKEIIREAVHVLDSLKATLEKKKANPFESLTLEAGEPNAESSGESIAPVIETVNQIIDKHESITENLTTEIREAFRALERDYVLEAVPRFEELEKSAEDAKTALGQVQGKPAKIRASIASIEREIIEHRRPAEELNQELRAYLGRDELKFDINL